MNARIVRGEAGVAAIAADDRAFNYGDGVFETILVHHGTPVWWDAHWARLAAGAQALGIALPNEAGLRRNIDAMLAGAAPRVVLKLVLSRGRGGRGYAPPRDAEPTVVLSLHAAPVPAPGAIEVRWCDTPLAIQPRLAGHKHLNRLEQVLARAEWTDAAVFEGLMRDTDGRAVCATAANLFIRRDGRWLTPGVHRCGIAGIARAWCRDALAATEADLAPADIEAADALFLCNAVRGILPVHRLGGRSWSPDAQVAALRARLAAAEPAFATE